MASRRLPTSADGPATWSVPSWLLLAFAGGGSLLLAAYSAALLFPASDAYIRFQSDFIYPAFPLAALALSLIPVVRERQDRAGWAAMSIGLLCWTLADASYTYYDLRNGTEPPSPGVVDALYYAGHIALAYALRRLTWPRERLDDRRWMLDGCAVAIVCGALAWTFLLEPMVSVYSAHRALVAMGYPVLDLVVFLLLVSSTLARGMQFSPRIVLLTASIALLTLADGLYTYLVSTVGYDAVGNPIDPLWLASYLLMGACFLIGDRAPDAIPASRQSMLGIALPYLAVAPIGALALFRYTSGDSVAELTFGVLAASVIIVARQFMTLRDNLVLNRSLEARTVELEATNDALRTSETRLRTVVSNAPVVLFALDAQGLCTFAEGRALDVVGLRPEDVIGKHPAEIFAGHATMAATVTRALAGEAFNETIEVGGHSFATQATPIFDESGAVSGVIGVATDVSERERFHTQLMHLATHDPLTGLLNRRRFDEELKRICAEAARYNLEGALLFIDLDQFKDVNDSRGHRAGDELLCQVSDRLERELRDTDIIARLGGDEFAVLLPHTSLTEAQEIAQRLVDVVASESFVAGGAGVRTTASIGVVGFPHDAIDPTELLSRADATMYRAKDDGRNRCRVDDAEIDPIGEAESRIGWQERVRRALEDDRFVLHAQPIRHVGSGEITTYELLLRMVEIDGAHIAPAAFLGIAERAGLIGDIDRWVIRRAVGYIAETARHGRDLRLHINLSARAFSDADLLPLIEQEIAAAGVHPSRLVFEVTETAAIANLEQAKRFLQRLHDLGCGIALDDFGVGFASFTHLKHLPVDYLKIDGSFVRNLARDATDRELVRAFAQVARALGKQTIAEFVEDAETLRLLADYRIDYAQGYHISRPMPLEDLLRAPVAA